MILLRKFFITCAVVFIGDATFQGMYMCIDASRIFSLISKIGSVASWILVGSLAAQLGCRPYASPTANALDAVTLGVLYVSLQTCLPPLFTVRINKLDIHPPLGHAGSVGPVLQPGLGW